MFTLAQNPSLILAVAKLAWNRGSVPQRGNGSLSDIQYSTLSQQNRYHYATKKMTAPGNGSTSLTLAYPTGTRVFCPSPAPTVVHTPTIF